MDALTPSTAATDFENENLWKIRVSQFHEKNEKAIREECNEPSIKLLNQKIISSSSCDNSGLKTPSAFRNMHTEQNSNKLAFSLNSLVHSNGNMYFGIGPALYEVPLTNEKIFEGVNGSLRRGLDAGGYGSYLSGEEVKNCGVFAKHCNSTKVDGAAMKPRCVCVLQDCVINCCTKFVCMFRISSAPDGSIFVLLSKSSSESEKVEKGSVMGYNGNEKSDKADHVHLNEETEENRLFHVQLDGFFYEIKLPNNDINYLSVYDSDTILVSSTMPWTQQNNSAPLWVMKKTSNGFMNQSEIPCVNAVCSEKVEGPAKRSFMRRVNQNTLEESHIQQYLAENRESKSFNDILNKEYIKPKSESSVTRIVNEWKQFNVHIDINVDRPVYILVQDALPDGYSLLMLENDGNEDSGMNGSTELYKCRIDRYMSKDGCSVDSGIDKKFRSDDGSIFDDDEVVVKLEMVQLFSASCLRQNLQINTPINHIMATPTGCIFCYDLSSAFVDTIHRIGYSEEMNDTLNIKHGARFHSHDYTYRGRCSAFTPAYGYLFNVELNMDMEGEKQICVYKQPLSDIRIKETKGDKCKHLIDMPWRDVKVVGSDGKSVQGHKLILASRSSFFESILNTKFQQMEDSSVYLPFDSKTITRLINYIYTEEVDTDDMHEMLDLCIAADFICLTNLSKWMTEALFRKLNPQTALNLYNACCKYNAASDSISLLKLNAAHIIVENIHIYTQSCIDILFASFFQQTNRISNSTLHYVLFNRYSHITIIRDMINNAVECDKDDSDIYSFLDVTMGLINFRELEVTMIRNRCARVVNCIEA